MNFHFDAVYGHGAFLQAKDSGANCVVESFSQESSFESTLAGVVCSEWEGSSLAAQARLWVFRQSTSLALNISIDNVTANVSSCSRRRLSTAVDGGDAPSSISSSSDARRRLATALALSTIVVATEDKSADLSTVGSRISGGFQTAAATLPPSFSSVKSTVSSETIPAPALGAVSYKTTIVTKIQLVQSQASAMASSCPSSSGVFRQCLPATAGISLLNR